MKHIIPRLLFPLLCLATPALAADSVPPSGALPQERQVSWQRMEYYAFVHFGLNTWTNREWGNGDENERLFNPDDFDARKIVHIFREAGMKGMILTAKHHDGFCLWQTKTTQHNISKSPWKNGRGDLVREFADACKAEGMKLGIYVSPWDRNNPGYAKPEYVKTFHEQIREVLTNYGPIFEIWFDGANGGDGYYGGAKEKRTIPPNYYDFPAIVAMVRQLQPNCVVWGAGAVGDARWGGSEQGHVGYPHWHTIDSARGGDGATGFPHGDRWVPAEGDVSIRPGWFWHENQNQSVKSPEHLLDVWLRCVGRGANLILNVPPDQHGHIHPNDIAALMEFKQLRDRLFPAGSHGMQAATPGSPVAAMLDGDIETYWHPQDGSNTPTVEIPLAKPATFDVIRLREQTRLGQRVEKFAIDAETAGAWHEITAGQTIGCQLLLKLPQPVTTAKLRLRVLASPAQPCVSELSLWKMPVSLAPSIPAH